MSLYIARNVALEVWDAPLARVSLHIVADLYAAGGFGVLTKPAL
jgi:hypothetical protein